MPVLVEEKKAVVEPSDVIKKEVNSKDEIFNFYNQKPESPLGTSLSETRIRHMVHQFKNSLVFRPKDNIIKFLNNKVSRRIQVHLQFKLRISIQVNAGYIGFRTAFEYIDPDNYGYLLNQEFEAVLKEFDIEFKPHEYSKFLKQYEIYIKH